MKETELKNVLFISYLFPPVAGGGVQRSSKFVKYLPQFSWNPIVLTVKEPYDFYRDDEMMQDVSGQCVIIRTFSIEPMKWVRKFLKKRSQGQVQADSSGLITKKSLKPGFLVKIKTYLLFPDNEILWLPFAVWKGMRVIRKNRPALIYSTASPFTDHLIALLLKKFSGLPWVADFRDLWVDRPNFPQNKWRLFVDRKLEKIVIENADHVVTATSLLAERFNQLYPAEKYTSITNGYDEDDFRNTSELLPPKEEFVITYTGIFNKEQNPQKFFTAVYNVIQQREDIGRKIKLRIIGQLDNPGDFENMIYFKKLELDKYSELISYLPHKQVISEMCRASILLLLVGEYPHNEGILTGKIFEYLRTGRPILAVVPFKGLAADVVRQTNSGLVVSNERVDDMANGIINLFDLFIQNKLEGSFNRTEIESFSRKNLTGQLSNVFNKIVTRQTNSQKMQGQIR